ncbi:hypothetical protein ACFFGV_12535 [Pontibacillus salicampi]|uniref:Lipoprotein n=1 Tax=Pontibacillus salicampi TaxID=1449801 RepID=A0ABV6LPQ0_9BACI
MKQLLMTSFLLILIAAGCSNANSESNENKEQQETEQEQTTSSSEQPEVNESHEANETKKDENTYKIADKVEQLKSKDEQSTKHEFTFEYTLSDEEQLQLSKEQISINTAEGLAELLDTEQITSVEQKDGNWVVKGSISFEAQDMNQLEVISNFQPFVTGLEVQQNGEKLTFMKF